MKTFEQLGIDIKYRAGNQKTVCPFCSEERRNKHDKALSVKLEPGDWGWQGPYNCKHCGVSGFATQNPVEKKAPSREYARPTLKALPISEKTMEWFTDRGISQHTLEYYKISTVQEWMPEKRLGDKGYGSGVRECIAIPYYRGGELINIKYRAPLKNFRLHKDGELIFFGLDGIRERNEVLITEGEFDAMACYEAGLYNAISVPNGASKGNLTLEYLDNCWDLLATKTKFILLTDDDEPGRRLRDELARRLGKERCWTVKYPEGCKDANEVLQRYSGQQLKEMVGQAEPWPLEGVYSIDEIAVDMDDYYTNGFPKGEKAGYPNLDDLISWRRGEFTIITGIPNSGKSKFLDQLNIRLAARAGWRFGIISPEQQPVSLHALMLAQQYVGLSASHGYGQRMNQLQYEKAKEFIGNHFHFVKINDINFSIDGILAKGVELVQRKGIDCLLIDPYNYIDHAIPKGYSETQYISELLTKIKRFKEQYDCHVQLVAHPRKIEREKGKTEYRVPTLYDVAGSSHFFNKADNGICVYRRVQMIPGQTDPVEVYIQKIRNFFIGHMGVAEFRFELASGRYTELGQSPEPILGNEHVQGQQALLNLSDSTTSSQFPAGAAATDVSTRNFSEPLPREDLPF